MRMCDRAKKRWIIVVEQAHWGVWTLTGGSIAGFMGNLTFHSCIIYSCWIATWREGEIWWVHFHCYRQVGWSSTNGELEILVRWCGARFGSTHFFLASYMGVLVSLAISVYIRHSTYFRNIKKQMIPLKVSFIMIELSQHSWQLLYSYQSITHTITGSRHLIVTATYLMLVFQPKVLIPVLVNCSSLSYRAFRRLNGCTIQIHSITSPEFHLVILSHQSKHNFKDETNIKVTSSPLKWVSGAIEFELLPLTRLHISPPDNHHEPRRQS